MSSSGWVVEFHPEFEEWVNSLVQTDQEALLAAIRILRDHGPALGRPLVDTVRGSHHNNMKELRPGSTGRTEVRVLFAFDPTRRAILLVGGDKSGDWSGWYQANVPVADDRFDEHLRQLKEKRGVRMLTGSTSRRRKGKRR